SWKCTDSTKPPTRGCTCTVLTACTRPVNSALSLTLRLNACATVTSGGGPPAGLCAWLSLPCRRTQLPSTAAAITGTSIHCFFILRSQHLGCRAHIPGEGSRE